MLSKQYYVYFLTNWNNKVLYVGVTNDLKRRAYEHKNALTQGFTQKYNVNKLVYCLGFGFMLAGYFPEFRLFSYF